MIAPPEYRITADSIAERDAIAAWCAGARAARHGRLDVVQDGVIFDFYGPDAGAAYRACNRLIAAFYSDAADAPLDAPTGPGGEA